MSSPPTGSTSTFTAWLRPLGATYLLLQGVGGTGWWLGLWLQPTLRGPFVATGAPEATLLAFAAADLLLYVGGSFACAYGLAVRRTWCFPLLCVHAGAAAYATLYTWGLFALDSHVWIPAVLMSPSLFVPAWLAWHARPGGRLAC